MSELIVELKRCGHWAQGFKGCVRRLGDEKLEAHDSTLSAFPEPRRFSLFGAENIVEKLRTH